MAAARLNPTLFDKLVSDLDLEGLREQEGAAQIADFRSNLRFYTVPKIERFNERALKNTVRREMNWLLNTTNLAATTDLDPFPQIKTSVLNFGVPDLAGKALTRTVVQGRAREIREAIVAFEPRMSPQDLEVEPLMSTDRVNAVTYVIRGDITAAVEAMPVEFKTDVELDTATVVVRE
ncbi:MAG TPA: type VI secretion system baseplate subunit TssE [Phenylobacterium sp.]|nr:type VI secretion system baseplate subunit TssE [Phenylobacterium sp.]